MIPNHIKIENKYIISLESRDHNNLDSINYIEKNIGFDNCIILGLFRFFCDYKQCKLIHILLDKGLKKDNILLCPNSWERKKYFTENEFYSFKVNWHCTLNSNVYNILLQKDIIYQMVYDGRMPPESHNYNYKHYKRHDLLKGCNHIKKAFISHYKNDYYLKDLLGLEYNYINDKILSPKEVNEVYNESKIGVILSEREGSCMASAQYLLCGLPVLSVECVGGREDYYNEYNSLVVKADEDSVKSGIEQMISKTYDREKIRNMLLDQREREDIPEIEKLFETAFKKLSIDLDSKQFVKKYIVTREGNRYKCNLFEKVEI